jgi:hypothetical protein
MVHNTSSLGGRTKTIPINIVYATAIILSGLQTPRFQGAFTWLVNNPFLPSFLRTFKKVGMLQAI